MEYGFSSDSEDDEEDDIFGRARRQGKLIGAGGTAVSQASAAEEDEDIHRREEELEAELNMATLRCEELKRTLKETITFASQAQGGAGAGAGAGGLKAALRADSPLGLGLGLDSDSDQDLDTDTGTDDATAVYPLSDEDLLPPPRVPPLGSAASAPSGAGAGAGAGVGVGGVTPRLLVKPIAAVKESPYQNLADPPSPSGRLGDRIHRLRQRCIEALGREAFLDAYDYLRDHDEVR